MGTRDNPTADHSKGVPLSPHRWAVFLAGGDGVRLREVTRKIAGDGRPKQFCRIMGDENLFHQTRTRLDPLFSRNRQVFVLSRAHENFYADDLKDASESCVIEQPLNRGTGIAVTLALLRVLRLDHDPVVAFFPCDHFYADQDSFRSTVRSAIECAEQNRGSIVVVGADAEYPEVDYGWIEPGAVISESAGGSISCVNRFWEKPSSDQAHALFTRGCLWNTFVTVGRAMTFLEMLCSEVPEAVRALSQAMADNTLELAYRRLNTVDLSRDVLGNLPHRLLVVRDRASGWVDLGSPARLLDTLSRNGIKPEWASERGGVFDIQQTLEKECQGLTGKVAG